ncbi:MAG TPA: hypothetical protein VF044_04785 [Actinomycetota bacterium]
MSGKTLAEKLGIRPGTAIWASPASRLDVIGSLPEDVRVLRGPKEGAAALLFVDDLAAAREAAARHAERLLGMAPVWVAYPKGNRADLNRDTLWPPFAEHGMRPIGQVALDEVWSALRFRPLRDGEGPFTGGGRR